MKAIQSFRRVQSLLMILIGFAAQGCFPQPDRVVTVYTSQDQVYAEPILAEFTKISGIETRTLYDSEAVKTVGLANRLIAERSNPQCDVFWNNEELRTRQLASIEIFREANGWGAFGFRTRRFVINTNQLSIAEAPKTLRALTNAAWRGRIALAYPLFGTTATHFLALRDAWGEPVWEEWCRALKANDPLLVDGNSVVVRLVGKGEAWIGLTDSDDIAAGRREGFPIIELSLTAESMLIPNTVGIIRHAPHPDAAQILFDYLTTANVTSILVNESAIEGTVRPEITTLEPNWSRLLADLDGATKRLKSIFLR